MEIEVGEFYRTKKGEIRNVEDLDDYSFLIDKFYFQIVKHSKNIIDLIEKGDIVHIKDVLHEDITYIWSEDYLKALKEDIQNGIKLVSIVTKEQMQSIEYKVEE